MENNIILTSTGNQSNFYPIGVLRVSFFIVTSDFLLYTTHHHSGKSINGESLPTTNQRLVALFIIVMYPNQHRTHDNFWIVVFFIKLADTNTVYSSSILTTILDSDSDCSHANNFCHIYASILNQDQDKYCIVHTFHFISKQIKNQFSHSMTKP